MRPNTDKKAKQIPKMTTVKQAQQNKSKPEKNNEGLKQGY